LKEGFELEKQSIAENFKEDMKSVQEVQKTELE
jgi:hypothetical protein